MKYDLSSDECAELLRLVLPRITQSGLSVNPVNYAVWFEYLAGISAPIQEAIDQRIADGVPIDADFTQSLYDQHIAPFDEEQLEHIRSDILDVIKRTEHSVSEADDRAAAYDKSLEGLGPQIEAADNPERLAEVVQGLSRGTGEMRRANADLRAQLDNNSEQIDALKKELDRARQEAVTDPLTGLVNRKGFDRAVQSALAEADGTENTMSLLMLDIDHFKRVNDNYGHLLGDKVIRVVADLTRKSIKGNDTAGRFGGEEFAVLLPNTPLDGAIVVADHIRTALEQGRIRRLDNNEPIAQVTLSAGAALYREGESLDALIERADQALYAAKESGRNRVCDERQLCAERDPAAA